MRNLTEHFTFEEMTKTKYPLLQDENRLQGEKFIEPMTRLCGELEELRGFIFRPIYITSGFRYLALNKRVGGSIGSQHMKGEAVDFVAKDFQDIVGLNFLFHWCFNNLDYGQLILENPVNGNPWIHLGLPREGKEKTAYVFDKGEYKRIIV